MQVADKDKSLVYSLGQELCSGKACIFIFMFVFGMSRVEERSREKILTGPDS